MPLAQSDMTLESPAFGAGRPIPRRFASEDENLSPPLVWRGAPAGTASFVLFCHDPDAPFLARGSYGFVHWLLYGIPGQVKELAEGIGGYTFGKNSLDQCAYMGPKPPPGHGLHRYYFWLLALDTAPDLDAGLTLPAVLEAVEPHVLGMNRLMGTYEHAA